MIEDEHMGGYQRPMLGRVVPIDRVPGWKREAPKRLIDMPIDDARREKWRAGQKKYGPKFVGHPLEQLDMEFLDALNYIDEAGRWGYEMGHMADIIRALCEDARDAYRNQTPEVA